MKDLVLKNKRILVLGAFLLGWVACFAILSLLLQDRIQDGLKCGFLTSFCIFVPGLAIFQLIQRKNEITNLHIIEFIAFSYCLGLGIALLMYCLLALSGFSSFFLRIAYAIVSLASVASIVIQDTKNGFLSNINVDYKMLAGYCAITAFILILAFFSMASANYLPVDHMNYYYGDNLFAAGNTIELAHQFPPNNFFRFHSNEGYSYHYINNIVVAVMQQFTKIPAVKLTFYYLFPQNIVFLTAAAFCFFCRFIKTKVLILLGIPLSLICTGNLSVSAFPYISHILLLPNGYDVALACLFITSTALHQQISQERFSSCLFTVIVVSFLIGVGTKGPLSAIFLLFMSLMLCWNIFHNSNRKLSLIYLVVLMVIFTAVFLLLELGAAKSYLSNPASKVPLYLHYEFYQNMKQEMLRIIPIELIIDVILALAYSFISDFPVFILFICGIAYIIISRQVKALDVISLITIAVGIILFSVITSGVGEQVYFLMACYPIVALEGLFALDRLCLVYGESFQKRICIIFASLLCLIGMHNAWFSGVPPYTIDVLTRGELAAAHSYNAISHQEGFGYSENTVTPEEYRAYTWIRKNTSFSDVLITNLEIDPSNNKYSYATGAFCERHVYYPLDNEIDTIRSCFRGDSEILKAVYHSFGVRYLIFIDRVFPPDNFKCEYASLVYENSGVSIYRLLFNE